MKINTSKKYLFPKEVANYFGVTLSTVRRWVLDGKLPAVQTPGGHSRILAKEFAKLTEVREAAIKPPAVDNAVDPAKKLLIVDDNDDILTLLSTTFKNRGYQVASCGNGKEALDLLSREQYPYILSDIMMPVMDGRTFLGEVKKKYRHAKVVMMSSSRTYQLLDFQLCGALDILVKPMGLNVLYEAFREIEREKRTSIRIAVHAPLTINSTINATSVNISNDGILLNTDQPLAQGADIRIQMTDKENQPLFTTTGKVIRSHAVNSVYTVAAYFLKSAGQELSHLFLDRLLVPAVA